MIDLKKKMEGSDSLGYGEKVNLIFNVHIIRSCIVYLESTILWHPLQLLSTPNSNFLSPTRAKDQNTFIGSNNLERLGCKAG